MLNPKNIGKDKPLTFLVLYSNRICGTKSEAFKKAPIINKISVYDFNGSVASINEGLLEAKKLRFSRLCSH
jgi:hypothetical protein